MTNKRTIYLYGELGKRFGKKHSLCVKSAAEAIRALCANFKGFRQYLLSDNSVGYEVWDGEQQLDFSKENFDKQGSAPIKIIPCVVGASAGFRIGAGLALIALAQFTPAGTFAAATMSTMTAMGASLVLGGVAELICSATSVSSESDSSTVNSDNYIFSSPQNVTNQGNPVAIGYGTMIVGSQVISATLTTNDIPITYE